MRVFFTTGIPFGLAAASIFTNDPPTNWVDFTLSALGSGALFGLMLGVIAYRFTSSLEGSIGKFLLLLFLLCLTSLFLAPVIYLQGDRLPHGSWVKLPPTPEKAVSFTGPTIRSQYYREATIIYVATQQGHFYSYDCRDGMGCQRKLKDEVPGQPQIGIHDKHAMFTNAVPRHPGKVISS